MNLQLEVQYKTISSQERKSEWHLAMQRPLLMKLPGVGFFFFIWCIIDQVLELVVRKFGKSKHNLHVA